MSHTSPANTHFDPTDPHGQHDRIHHHVYPWQFLTFVLLVLLFFTFITVVVSDMESWLVNNIAITIPDYVNALIAMFIATIKATFVVLFFMGLRRGNPMNAVIFLFTLAAFGTFLGFTAIDLLNRGHVYEYKAQSVSPGGTGMGINPVYSDTTLTQPIYLAARENYIAKLMESGTADKPGPMTEAEAWAYWEKKYHAKDDHGSDHPAKSTADRQVLRTGLTPGLFSAEAPSDHGDSHSGDAKNASDHTSADETTSQGHDQAAGDQPASDQPASDRPNGG